MDFWMIGDQETDVLAGINAGCAESIHVLSGRTRQAAGHASMAVPDLAAVADVFDAVQPCSSSFVGQEQLLSWIPLPPALPDHP